MTAIRYLVCHDYGMGGLWWWIRAKSPGDILAMFAEVEVIDDPDTLHSVQPWGLEELDIAAAAAGPLRELAERRAQQRHDPAFGKLLGKDRVYLRMADPAIDPGEWFDLGDPQYARMEISKDERGRSHHPALPATPHRTSAERDDAARARGRPPEVAGRISQTAST